MNTEIVSYPDGPFVELPSGYLISRNSLNPRSRWPDPLNKDALIGLAGEFVQLVQPESEADDAALLITFLVTFGCLVGSGPHYQVEATRHGVNLFAVLVGETSKARKGTAIDRTRDLFNRVDADFQARIQSGLSSGEGLIEAVSGSRKSTTRRRSFAGHSESEHRETQDVDAGLTDALVSDDELVRLSDMSTIWTGRGSRLLVIEGEFGSVLKQLSRDGNILGTTMRDAWDGRALRILARGNKDTCLEPHISLIGAITNPELQRLLSVTDRHNGFGNRILFCCARRSKLLPNGGKGLSEEELYSLVTRLRAAQAYAQQADRLQFDVNAAKLWSDVYSRLSHANPGIVGAMTARSEAQTCRLAAIYALLDCSDEIRTEHLRAAMEVWRYCADSVNFLFGESLEDPTANIILRRLMEAPDGLTQTEVSKIFGGHKKAAELSRVLESLKCLGKVKSDEKRTKGAPVTTWNIRVGAVEDKANLAE